jgi:hypothetical protein
MSNRNKIFNNKIAEAKILFDKVKSNIKNSSTRIKYINKISDTINLNSVNKIIRELNLIDKHDKPIIQKDLPKIKRHEIETERNKKYDPIINSLQLKNESNKNLYKRVLDVVGISPHVKVFNTKLRPSKSKNDIMQIMINKSMNKQEIENLGSRISQVFRLTKGAIQTSIRSNGWDYAGDIKLGQDVKLFDLYDNVIQGNYSSTSFFIRIFPEPIGGTTPTNNCLYDCLLEYLGNRLIWKTSTDFRRFLKVKENEKIDIKYMKQIETKLNVNINVSGDYTYTGHLEPHLMKINLILINQHYSINIYRVKNLTINNQISKIERKPLIYDSKKFEVFDGKKLIKLSKELYFDILNLKTEFILIPSDKADKIEYDKFIDKANKLKLETNDKINLYKTGSDKYTALNIFNKMTQHIQQPDYIDQV